MKLKFQWNFLLVRTKEVCAGPKSQFVLTFNTGQVVSKSNPGLLSSIMNLGRLDLTFC